MIKRAPKEDLLVRAVTCISLGEASIESGVNPEDHIPADMTEVWIWYMGCKARAREEIQFDQQGGTLQ